MGMNTQGSTEDLIILEKGEILMKQGEKGECAYLLLSGKLVVQRESPNENVLIREVRPIELIGELAIFSDTPRSATVVIQEKAELIRINKHRLRQMIRRSPDIAEIVIKILCSRLQDNAEKIFEIESAQRKAVLSSLRWPPGDPNAPASATEPSEDNSLESPSRRATVLRHKPST
ncbi:MAG: cyclic nucleotide-binding domain-containing protein [bacterium]|jgi:NTE family protein|nr:cyclic nucleotide-binding domain-containing protein [bacterium]